MNERSFGEEDRLVLSMEKYQRSKRGSCGTTCTRHNRTRRQRASERICDRLLPNGISYDVRDITPLHRDEGLCEHHWNEA